MKHSKKADIFCKKTIRLRKAKKKNEKWRKYKYEQTAKNHKIGLAKAIINAVCEQKSF